MQKGNGSKAIDAGIGEDDDISASAEIKCGNKIEEAS